MRIVFIGTGDIGLPSLQYLFDSPEHTVAGVVTQPDKPVGRKQELMPSAIKLLGLERGVPVFQPKKIRAEGALEEMRGLAPEVVVVMAYGQILPGALLRWPTVACLNLHASLLPKHRGAAPVHAAVEAGDAESGITVMHMDEGLDTGPVLLMKRLKMGPRETAGSLHDRLGALAPEALAEALTLLKEGRAPSIPQDDALATYAAKLTREHGEIDWTASATLVDRKIRAMNPWPSAHTWVQVGGEWKKLKVFDGLPQAGEAGQPGAVLKADREGILVGTAEGTVLLREVQLEGKKRMSAEDFLRGFALAPGTILGRS